MKTSRRPETPDQSKFAARSMRRIFYEIPFWILLMWALFVFGSYLYKGMERIANALF
ncbi:MAG TPA: hypothetical protein VKZ59_16135 [Acidobacteriota bacterium]|nr:hypothetical protein [Acidobacteriota bacterium]